MQVIKTALLSYGMSGKVFHAPFLDFHSGFKLIGAWERTKKFIQKDFPETKSYASFDDLLKDDIDLVIVNTPVETHFEYAKKALLAGKNVVVEKAFTTTVAEAAALNTMAKEKNLGLAVFQNRRWDSDFKTVKSIYNQAILGDLVEAEFHFDRFNPDLSPKKHKETPNAGAGILKDLGPHLIDQSLHLFGFPKAVFANIKITRNHSLVDDWFDIVLYYIDFNVRLKAGFFVKEAVPAYQLHGKNGSFLKPRGDVQETYLKLGIKPNCTTWGTEPIEHEGLLHVEFEGKIIKEKIPTLQGNYYDFFDALYFSIINKTIAPVTGEDGFKVMQIIEAAVQSNLELKTIKL